MKNRTGTQNKRSQTTKKNVKEEKHLKDNIEIEIKIEEIETKINKIKNKRKKNWQKSRTRNW